MTKLTLGKGIPTSYQSNINLGLNTRTQTGMETFQKCPIPYQHGVKKKAQYRDPAGMLKTGYQDLAGS